MNFYEKLSNVITSIKAPKGQFNSFGKYKYRSCEDLLEAIKPNLNGLVLTVSDDIVFINERFYLKATATITDGENSVSSTGFAREALSKKGMDEAQVTGSSSSYARKYALNGLFCIDDTKDADNDDNTKTEKRNYKLEMALKDRIQTLIAEITVGMTIDDTVNWIKQNLRVDSISVINQMNESQLKEIGNKLKAIKDAK